METRQYRNSGIPALKLGQIRDYVNSQNSQSLGERWAAKVWWYRLHYHDGTVDCKSYEEVKAAVRTRGETNRHETYFESETGRKLHLIATHPRRIVLEVENGKLTVAMTQRIEVIMGLIRYERRVFITHGRDPAWHRVKDFVEQECTKKIPTLELAYAPSKGRTIIEKLDEESQNCSFAIIVMTGEDAADTELRARENVIHEIGFFQGRYGRDRVCLLHEDDVNIPSNLLGVVYCSFPKGHVTAALIELQKELIAAFPDDPPLEKDVARRPVR